MTEIGEMLNWAEAVLKIAAECDSFNTSPESSKGKCIPFLCCGVRIGLLKPSILQDLLHYTTVFEAETVNQEVVAVRLSRNLSGVEERTLAVNKVLKDLQSNDSYPCLKGWRNENYAAAECFGKTVLFHCERAGARLLGIRQYGVHLNGYVRTETGGYRLWIARRSPTKATYPGMLDNMVAGAIAANTDVIQTLVKECQEEASLNAELASHAIATGTISYFNEAEDGLQPETEYIYELELPTDFVPTPEDGEVSIFYLWDLDQIKVEMAKGNFKPNSALVILQFLLHHGLLSPSCEPEYERLAGVAHVNLSS